MPGLVQQGLDEIVREHAGVTDGALADYIPELRAVDPAGFGLTLSASDGFVYESGDTAVEFTIQSVSKPFTYALALDRLGQAAVDDRIGVEPSGEAFNEISVDRVSKTPKNPMINAGAIAAVSLVPGTGADRFELIREFYSACAGRQLRVDDDVYASEKATGSRNRAIAYMLESFGVLDGNPEEVLDVYFRQCSLLVTSTDLARMAATLARGGLNPFTGRNVTDHQVVQRTLSVMTTCGMYDAAGDWVSAVGMPAKSGVGGGIAAVLPGQLGIGVYSPLLDARGNSVRGSLVCRSLSQRLGLHFLTVSRESRSTIRAVYDPQENIRVYEVHGDLHFAGAEQVLRNVGRDAGQFAVAILDVSRLDTVNDAARELLNGLFADLAEAGKVGLLVDPDDALIPAAEQPADLVFSTIDDAVEAASGGTGQAGGGDVPAQRHGFAENP